MMEALSISTDVTVIIQLTTRIAQVCKSYMDSVGDYPRQLRVIFVEIKSLEVVLQGLQFLRRDDAQDASIISHLEGADGPVQGCKKAIESLNALLPNPTTPPSNSSGKSKKALLSALDALAWPLKEKAVQRLLDDLMRFKSTISMAIGGSLLYV